VYFSVFYLVFVLGPALLGQTEKSAQAAKDVTATREIIALTYPEGTGISVKLQGTARLPRANGEAKTERKKGRTEINIKLEEMKPATFFGGDYNTYVLWVVSPQGQVGNVGEFILEGNHSKLNVSTPLETFGLFVTAEPHFLVSSPSRFVVLENTRPAKRTGGLIQISPIKYRGFEGTYNAERETLANLPETKGEVRADVSQARAAVRLAEGAGAERFAPKELAKARTALRQAEAAAASGMDPRNLMVQAHEVVRQAVEAQKLAEERSAQAALDAERKASADEAAKLEKARREAETEAERARRAAEERARRAAEEARLRREADERAHQAQQQAQQLAAAKSEADLAAERARRESEEARARMQQALSKVVETRETARGLILNLPDILFDSGKATLRMQAREVLSKVAGILLVARGYRLDVEGHTDDVGGDEYNQKLSERRAQSVRDYLVSASVPPDIVTTRGFGKTQPIAPNTTAAGRQKNRRVEIVIQDIKEYNP
jgi:outer membrane protein OmpA-like peptidoglycan-associated protein